MLIIGLWFWLSTRNQETTDDAFTKGDAVTVAPKTSGYVVKLLVKDNKRVRKGDLLVQIDPRDATAERDRARAQLGLAQAQLALARVQYSAQLAQLKPSRPALKPICKMPRRITAASAASTPARLRSKTSITPAPRCSCSCSCSCRCFRPRPTSKRANVRSIKRRHSWKRPILISPAHAGAPWPRLTSEF